MILRDKFFINGQWATPSAKETIDVHNAGTGEVMGKVPAGTREGHRRRGRRRARRARRLERDAAPPSAPSTCRKSPTA